MTDGQYGERTKEVFNASKRETKPAPVKFSETPQGQKVVQQMSVGVLWVVFGTVVYFLAMGGYALWRAVFGV